MFLLFLCNRKSNNKNSFNNSTNQFERVKYSAIIMQGQLIPITYPEDKTLQRKLQALAFFGVSPDSMQTDTRLYRD